MRRSGGGAGSSSPGSSERRGTPPAGRVLSTPTRAPAQRERQRKARQGGRKAQPPALTEALERAEAEKQRGPLAQLTAGDHDWSAVLELVSDQARATRLAVGVSNELDARLQRLESWQMEQISSGGGGAGSPRGGAWSSQDIDAADGWQIALAGINERMGKVGTAFGTYVQTNAKKFEKLEAKLDGDFVARLAAVERATHSAGPPPPAGEEARALGRPAGAHSSAPEQVTPAEIADVEDRMRNEMCEALDELEKDLEARVEELVARGAAQPGPSGSPEQAAAPPMSKVFAKVPTVEDLHAKIDLLDASVSEVNQRLTSEVTSLAASVAWPVKEQGGQLQEQSGQLQALSSRADDIDARVQTNTGATVTQAEDLGVRLDALKQWSESASSKLSSQKKTVRAVASTVTDLSRKLAAEASQRSEAEQKAKARVVAVEQLVETLRAEVKSTTVWTPRHEQQLVESLRAEIKSATAGMAQRPEQPPEAVLQIASTDGGSVDKSELTTWMADQAEIQALQGGGIEDLREELSKVGGLEERVLSVVDARVASSSSALEARLGELREESGRERADCGAALDENSRIAAAACASLETKLTALARIEAASTEAADEMSVRVAALAQEQAAASESVSSELAKLEGVLSTVSATETAATAAMRDVLGQMGAGLREEIAGEAIRRSEGDDQVTARTDELAAALSSVQSDLESAKEATVKSQQEVLGRIDADGDGKIDQSEWTQWVSQQAATVEKLEGRLGASIAELKGELSKVNAFEESVSVVDLRSSALDARLSELLEESERERASAKEAGDAFAEALSGLGSKQDAANEQVQAMEGRVGDMRTVAQSLAQALDMAMSEAGAIEANVVRQAEGWQRLRDTEATLSKHMAEYAESSGQLDSRLGSSHDGLVQRLEALEVAQQAQAEAVEASGGSADQLVERIVALESATASESDALSTEFARLEAAGTGAAEEMSARVAAVEAAQEAQGGAVEAEGDLDQLTDRIMALEAALRGAELSATGGISPDEELEERITTLEEARERAESCETWVTMEVACPWDSEAGDSFDLELPGAAEGDEDVDTIEVTVPQGISAGETFEVEVPGKPEEKVDLEAGLQKLGAQVAEWQSDTEKGIIDCLGEYASLTDSRLVDQVQECVGGSVQDCLMAIAEAEVMAERDGVITGAWWTQTLRKKFGFALCAEPEVVEALGKRLSTAEERLASVEGSGKAADKQLADVALSLGKTAVKTNTVRESHEELTGVVEALDRGLNAKIQEEVDDRIGNVIGRTKGELKKEVSRLEAKLTQRLKKATTDQKAAVAELEQELWAKSAQLTAVLEQQKVLEQRASSPSPEGEGGGGEAAGGGGGKEVKRLETKLIQKIKAGDDKNAAKIGELEAKVAAIGLQ